MQYSRGREALDAGIRTFAATYRAMLEAEKEVDMARDAKQQRAAQQRYRDAQLALQQWRLDLGVDRLEHEKQLAEAKAAADEQNRKKEEVEAERTAELQKKYEEVAGRLTELDTAYEAAEDEAKKQRLAGERRVAQNELSLLATQLKYTQPKYAAEPTPTAAEQWETDMQFIQERINAGDITEAEGKKARELALKQFLKMPITDSDNPLLTYVTRQKAIKAAVSDGTITQEEADRMLTSTEETLFPLEEDTENTVAKKAEDIYAAKIETGASPEEAAEARDAYINKTAGTPEETENPILEKAKDAYDAVIATGGTEEEAKAAEQRVLDEETALTGGTADERIFDEVEKIHDPELRKWVRSLGAKGISSRKTRTMFLTLINQAKAGDITAALDSIGDVWDFIDESKKAPLRLQYATTFSNMREKLEELKTEYGIETDRIFAAFTQNMSKAEFSAAIANFGIKWLGGENLTNEQKRAAASIQTYINSQLVQFLHAVSGAAVTEQEFARIRAMFPGIFQEESVNIGTIDGNIEFLRDAQLAYYAQESDPDFAAKVMAAQGWGDIRTSTEEERSENIFSDNIGELEELARLAESEEEFIKELSKDFPNREDELKEIYQRVKIGDE